MNETSAAVALPLVYNIVRRTVSSDAAVREVVRDTMVRVVQEGAGERSRIVMVTVDRIRAHRAPDHRAGRPEPGGPAVEIDVEFVDRNLDATAVVRQRREIARAVRRLRDDERELLALWSLERGGHIVVADVAVALGEQVYHVAVRLRGVQRRLEAARLLERALSATPRCPGLVVTGGSGWSPLLRHVGGCARCRLTAHDLVPVEALLTGAALLRVPDDLAAHVLSKAHAAAQAAEPTVEIGDPIAVGDPRPSKPGERIRRIAGSALSRPLLTAIGAAGVCTALVAVMVANAPSSPSSSIAVGLHVSSTTVATTVASIGHTGEPPAPPPITTTAQPTTTTTTAPTTTVPTTTVPTRAEAPATGQPAGAGRVVELVNEARVAAGCKPLRVDDRLVKAAQAHSTDMAERGYFSHTTPEGVDPSERMLAAGFNGSRVAENIAAGQSTPEAVMNSWMNSPGHRGNILDCDLSLIGVGLDKRGWRWTQNFGSL